MINPNDPSPSERSVQLELEDMYSKYARGKSVGDVRKRHPLVQQAWAEISKQPRTQEARLAGLGWTKGTLQIPTKTEGIYQGPLKPGTEFTSTGGTTPIAFTEPQLVVREAPEREGTFAPSITAIQERRGQLLTKEQRGGTLSFGETIERTKLGVESTVIGGIGGFIDLGKSFFTSPVTTTKQVGTNIVNFDIAEFGAGIGRTARTEPAFFTGQVLGEVLLFKGTGKLISAGEKGFELGRTAISPSFKSVGVRTVGKTGFEERFITDIPKIGGKGEIVLIPAAVERKIPGILEPSVRGGFGFTQKEQRIFFQQPGPVISSQVDFLGFGKPLERTLFGTPPLKGVGYTRISRAGLFQKEAGITDILSGEFTFKKTKPQFLAFPEGVKVFESITPGRELEVIKTTGIPYKISRPAVSIVEGRRVEIIETRFKQPSMEVKEIIGKTKPPTTREIKLIERETGLSFRQPTKPYYSPTRFTGILSTLSFATPTFKTGIKLGSKATKQVGRTGLGFSAPSFSIPSLRTGTPGVLRGGSGGAISTPRITLGEVPRFASTIPFGFTPSKLGVSGKRKFKRIPSFRQIYMGGVGKESKFEVTGLVERAPLTKLPKFELRI